MSFLNPIALWALLGICIPVIIHFWNGKQGKTIAWAAMGFLDEVDKRVSKGLKFENWLVLLLRVLIISLLVLLLSQLFWFGKSETSENRLVHVLTGEKKLWEEYRFEIQQALDRDELVVLANKPSIDIYSLEELFKFEMASNSDLQSTLDGLADNLDSLILYVPNSNLALLTDYYSSPVLPNIQVGEASESNSKRQKIKTQSNRFFALNEVGILDSINNEEGLIPEFDYSENIIDVYIQCSETEKQFIEASLASISEIYGFEFRETENPDSAEMIFSNKLISELDDKKLYFFSNSINYHYPESENQVIFTKPLTFEQSELIRNGQLPELILEKFLSHIGIYPKSSALEINQLKNRFLVKSPSSKVQKANLNEWLTALLLGIMFLERYLAFKQGI